MTQLGFYYDAENCIGCHTCQVACKDTNRLNVGENYRTVKTYCTGQGYTPRLYHISMTCNHCAAPSCMAACTQQALVRDGEGLVQVDEAQCNGCGDCVEACPYEAITVLPEGVAGKCNGCLEIRALGEEPACVASCPQRVIKFDEIDALRATYQGDLYSVDAAPLGGASKVQPNLVMRLKDCMTDEDYDRMII